MFWMLAFVSLLFPLAVKIVFNSKISLAEWALQTVITLVVVVSLYHFGRYNQTQDYEIWNGSVTSKEVKRESCPWGWVDYQDGFCTEYSTRQVKDGTKTCTGTGNDRRCTDNYKTQYNYHFSWEQKYFVFSNIGETWQINRVDRQGASTPGRWEMVNIGDAVSKTNSYTNYVKAAANSLFNKDKRLAEFYADNIPEYPIEIYDYYRVNRAITSPDTVVPNLDQYNAGLSDILKELGPAKQMNAVILFTNIADPAYADAVLNSWQGAKKNDAVIIAGINDDQSIAWLRIHSWSKNKLFEVELRDHLLDLGTIADSAEFLNIVNTVAMNNFERQPMAEFEYLADEIEPSTGFIIVIFVILIILSAILTFIFHKHDIFGK